MKRENNILNMARSLCSCAGFCDLEDWYYCNKDGKCVRVMSIATTLFLEGYRKVSEGAVVIPKNITEETSVETLVKIAKYNESIRRKTASEIFEWLKEHTTENDILKTYFKENFGLGFTENE